jgi:COP9 signalosome complex subunit 6
MVERWLTQQTCRLAEQVPIPRIFGALLGTQSGRHVEIRNSFEFAVSGPASDPVVERELLDTRLDLFREVFPQYELLGWYSTGSVIGSEDRLVHSQIIPLNESPLVLLLDTTGPTTGVSDLPITVYVRSV